MVSCLIFAARSDQDLAWLGTSIFSRLSSAPEDGASSTPHDSIVETEPLLLAVAGTYLAALLPRDSNGPWLEAIAALCSVAHRYEACFMPATPFDHCLGYRIHASCFLANQVHLTKRRLPVLFCSDIHVVLDGAEKETLLNLPCPENIPLLLCAKLLTARTVQISSFGSGPPFTAQIKELLLQDNVTVAPHILSAPNVSMDLPQPFPSQALLCKMRALVIARRRVSKRLVFVDLAPLASAGDPDVLGHTRRASWQYPHAQGQSRCFSCL